MRWARSCVSARPLALGLAGALIVQMRASAAQPTADLPPSPPPQTLLGGQVELARLVDIAAHRLKINLQYDAAALRGAVTLRLEGAVTDDELWAITNRALAASGFTTVRATAPANGAGAYQVVKIADAAGLAAFQPPLPHTPPSHSPPSHSPPSSPGPDSIPGPPPGYEAVVFEVRHRSSTKEIADALKLVISKPGGSVTEITTGGGGRYLIVADLQPRLADARHLVAMLDVPPPSDDALAVTRIVPVRNLAPTALVAIVQQVASKRELVTGQKVPGELVALPSGSAAGPPGVAASEGADAAGAVMLVSPAANTTYWTALIEQLDQREAVESRAYTPRHFAVKEVARLVEQSVRDPGNSAPGAGSAGADDRWRLVIDDLTGTFMVTATPTQHEKIDAIMDRLDSVPASARRPVRSFKVRNRGVNELLAVLNDLVRSGVLDAPPPGEADDPRPAAAPNSAVPSTTASSTVGTPTPPSTAPPSAPWPPTGIPLTSGGTTSPPTSSSPRAASIASRSAPAAPATPGGGEAGITLTADEATSTIIAIGEPRLLTQLEALIQSLDVRQPQVMLEVLLVSLSDTQSLALGTELEKIEIRGDTAIRLSSLFGLSTSDFGGSAAGGGRTAADRPGFTGLVLNPGEFAVVVRAMESLNKGRSLTIPKVLVGNNQQATFNSTLQQPFATTTISSSTGDVSSQSFGGTQDAGTKVAIKPQIAEGDHLVLGYNIELSSFVGSSSGGLPPPKQQNTIQSSVSVPDGFTVVVGGLEITADSRSTTQVPLIGSIPLVGELFKNRSKDNTRSRFFVFIRANVLRQNAFEDLKYLSATAAGAGGGNVSDGFPDVQPQVIR